jgi:hypothetical protein
MIVAPVVESRRFRVRVPGYALRDLGTIALPQVIGYRRGAKSVTAYRRLNAGVRSTAADHVPNVRARHCLACNGAGIPVARFRSLPLLPFLSPCV